MMEQTRKTLDPLDDASKLMEMLSSGCPVPLTVTGSSMMPLLKSGRDAVCLQKNEPIRRGRILFFRRDNGMFILHRVRRILPDGRLLVNGDAQTWCETVRPEQAAAVVTVIHRKGKSVRWNHPLLRLWDALWYPTRPIRPLLFRMYGRLRPRKQTKSSAADPSITDEA